MTTDRLVNEVDRIAAATRALRGLHDLTQPKMARRMSVSTQILRAIERSQLPTARRYILQVCNATGVTLSEFAELGQLLGLALNRMRAAGMQDPLTPGGEEAEHEDAEPQPPADKRTEPHPGLRPFPVRGSSTVKEYHVPVWLVEELRSAFEGLPVIEEINRARGWVATNMSRRKTARGMPKFLFGWMERAVRSHTGRRAPRQVKPWSMVEAESSRRFEEESIPEV